MRKTSDVEYCFGIRIERIVNKSRLAGNRLCNRQVRGRVTWRRSNWRLLAGRRGSHFALRFAECSSPIHTQARLRCDKRARAVSLRSQGPRNLVKPASLPGDGITICCSRLFAPGDPHGCGSWIDRERYLDGAENPLTDGAGPIARKPGRPCRCRLLTGLLAGGGRGLGP